MKIFCLIPAYNEEGNLKLLTGKLVTELKKEKVPYTIFFILQGKDKSREIVKSLQNKYPQIKFIYYSQPLGIGKAYKIGFEHVDKDCTHVLTLDADLNHNPQDINKFIKAMKETSADVIIGSRFTHGGRFLDKRHWKRMISFLVNFIITNISGVGVHDISSGFRLIKREVIEKVRSHLTEIGYPSYMEFILLAHKNKYNIQEVSIVYTPRIWGISKMKTIDTLKDYLFFILKVLLNF